MKKLGFLLMLLSLIWTSQPARAQESVEEAYTFGERCLEKIRNRRFKKFDENYTQALKDMDRLRQEAAQKQFGYEDLIEIIPNWIRLNDLLRKFDAESISNKGKTITFRLNDYRKILEEAKVKAAKDRYEAGKEIIANNSDYSKSKHALKHFNKAETYSNEFQDDIKAQKGILYYNAGVQYSQSDDIEKVEEAREFFANTQEYNPGYKDLEAEIKKLKPRGASLLYDMAQAKEKEKSFEAQLEAAKLYDRIGENWVKDYKDAAGKAKAAWEKGVVDVYFIDKYGEVLSDPDVCQNIDFINTPEPPAELKNLDLRKEENYTKAAEITGKGFILAKPTSNFGELEYIPPETTTKKETHEAYVQVMYTNEVETERKKITESEYKKAKKRLGDEEISDKKGYDWKKVTGVSTEEVTRNRMLLKCPLEIWDLRDPQSPAKLGVIDVGWSEGDHLVRTTYSGADEAKPYLKNSSRKNLQSKELLTDIIKKRDSSVKGSIDRKSSTLHYDLPKLIEYREIR